MTRTEAVTAQIERTPVRFEQNGQTFAGWVERVNQKTITVFITGFRYTERVAFEDVHLGTEADITATRERVMEVRAGIARRSTF